MVPVRYEEH